MGIYLVFGIMGAVLAVIVFALYVHDRELREQIKKKKSQHSRKQGSNTAKVHNPRLFLAPHVFVNRFLPYFMRGPFLPLLVH